VHSFHIQPKTLACPFDRREYLLTETDPTLVFTTEDLSAEQRLMAQTAEKFMDKEVMPNLEALEHQQAGLTQKLFRQAGELGLLGMGVPEAHGDLGLNKVSAVGGGAVSRPWWPSSKRVITGQFAKQWEGNRSQTEVEFDLAGN
jgi:alkylation response protein AidB-like acyl-CoA dehydrogenase